jgi:YD repeat-containing protein
MKSYDNSGKLVGEINNFRTTDGKSISTVTAYDPFGRPTSQSVAVWEPSGKVSTTTTIGGKLLP